MKDEVKKKHTATEKNPQPARKVFRNDTAEQPLQHPLDKEANDHEDRRMDGATGAEDTPRTAGRSGRKSRDNFGSYKGY